MEYKAEKKNFNARIAPDDVELLNEFIRIYQTNYPENELQTDREVFGALLESAISRKKPIEVSRKEDIEKINSLQLENENLKSAVNSLQTENENLKQAVNSLQADFTSISGNESQLQEHAKKLENQLSTSLENLQQLFAENEVLRANQKTVRLVPDNEITILLNDFQLSLLRAYLQNKEVVQLFRQANRKGELNGMLDIIDSPEEKQNIANLLTTTFIGSAYQKVLKPILTPERINLAFKTFKAKHHEPSTN